MFAICELLAPAWPRHLGSPPVWRTIGNYRCAWSFEKMKRSPRASIVLTFHASFAATSVIQEPAPFQGRASSKAKARRFDFAIEHPDALDRCPLLEVKRTLRFLSRMSAFDPKR